MSETTEILFNSPALHSLKREQLQKLCKIHSIKANGKNTEIIERLKEHALTLPKDDPLSIAARSEPGSILQKPPGTPSDTSQSDSELGRVTRPSEQWEIVMESIQEVEETASSQGTLSSLRTVGTGSGEFGTSGSKCKIIVDPHFVKLNPFFLASTVGSSIRAFATSLGLKRTNKTNNSSATSKASVAMQEQLDDELTQHSIPYSAVRPATPPLNDNFTFDPTTAPHTRMSFASNGEPLPGCSLRPGEPAPDNARLSLGLGLGGNEATAPTVSQPTTTIRLVSNNSTDSVSQGDKPKDVFQTPKLKPFKTTFDLVMSPGGPTSDGTAGTGGFWAPDVRPGGFQNLYPTLTVDDLPPGLPPSPIKTGVDKTAVGSLTTNSNANTLAVPATTTATTSARQSLTPDPFIFGSPLPQHSVSNTQFKTAATSVLEEMNKRLGLSGVEGVGMDIVEKLKPGTHTKEQLEREQRELKPLPSRLSTGGEITKKFDEMHQVQFDKMEGIDGTAKRRGLNVAGKGTVAPEVPPPVVGKKRKSIALGGPDGKPRRPTTGPGAVGFAAVGGGRTSGTTRVISNGRRGKILPGAFDDNQEEEEEEEDGLEVEERGGKRVRMDPDADDDARITTATIENAPNGNTKGKDAMDVDNEDQEEEEKRSQSQKDREREVIKRKLEMSRAKRRSSAGGPGSAVRRRSGRPSAARNSIGESAMPYAYVLVER